MWLRVRVQPQRLRCPWTLRLCPARISDKTASRQMPPYHTLDKTLLLPPSALLDADRALRCEINEQGTHVLDTVRCHRVLAPERIQARKNTGGRVSHVHFQTPKSPGGGVRTVTSLREDCETNLISPCFTTPLLRYLTG